MEVEGALLKKRKDHSKGDENKNLPARLYEGWSQECHDF